MRCAHHPWKHATGYCSVCGDFGCGDCLVTHEGQLFCKKDYAPIQERADRAERRQQSLRRHERQRLIAHTADGRTYKGYCLSLRLTEPGFRMELTDDRGEPLGTHRFLAFDDLKKVSYVKSFDGAPRHGGEFQPWQTSGGELIVVFKDGEILRGASHHPYHGGDARFHVIPADLEGNEISVLVERSATDGIFRPEEYRDYLHDQLARYLRAHAGDGRSRDALAGDFYFKSHEYDRARRHYHKACEVHPGDLDARKRYVASLYNLGVHHIKRHEFTEALKCMEAVKRLAPGHEKAARKIALIHDLTERARRNGWQPGGGGGAAASS